MLTNILSIVCKWFQCKNWTQHWVIKIFQSRCVVNWYWQWSSFFCFYLKIQLFLIFEGRKRGLLHVEMCVAPHTTQMCMLWQWQGCCCGMTGTTHSICPPFRTSLLSSKIQEQPTKSPWCRVDICHCQCYELVLSSGHESTLCGDFIMSLKAATGSTIISQTLPRQKHCHTVWNSDDWPP